MDYSIPLYTILLAVFGSGLAWEWTMMFDKKVSVNTVWMVLFACLCAFMTEANPDLKQVVNTNKVIIQVNKHGDKVLILTVIDNLLKGASGQAVQNMNLMFGLEETCGLKLKSVAF